MSVHAGEIPIEEVAAQLATYLLEFGKIVALYRSWTEAILNEEALTETLESFPKRSREAIEGRIREARAVTVYEAYNLATWYATHEMRSYRTAFNLLALVNRSFQKKFPAPETVRPTDTAGPARLAAAAQ